MVWPAGPVSVFLMSERECLRNRREGTAAFLDCFYRLRRRAAEPLQIPDHIIQPWLR